MKFSASLKVGGLILLMFATQGATCDPRQSNARLLEYKLISDERTIDPATGEVVLISHWEYENGRKTTTTKRLAPGTEERQWDRPPRPEPVVVD